MEHAFHIFVYLGKFNQYKIVFDSSYTEIPESHFVIADWNDFYLYLEEPI